MASKEKIASDKFSCSDRERAIFEAGIKLGMVCHQFVGTPINSKNKKSVEKAIEETVSILPYVKKAKVKILCDVKGKGTFSQTPLTENMIDAKITVEIDNTSVTAEMRYDKDLDYPLMYVSKVD